MLLWFLTNFFICLLHQFPPTAAFYHTFHASTLFTLSTNHVLHPLSSTILLSHELNPSQISTFSLVFFLAELLSVCLFIFSVFYSRPYKTFHYLCVLVLHFTYSYTSPCFPSLSSSLRFLFPYKPLKNFFLSYFILFPIIFAAYKIYTSCTSLYKMCFTKTFSGSTISLAFSYPMSSCSIASVFSLRHFHNSVYSNFLCSQGGAHLSYHFLFRPPYSSVRVLFSCSLVLLFSCSLVLQFSCCKICPPSPLLYCIVSQACRRLLILTSLSVTI